MNNDDFPADIDVFLRSIAMELIEERLDSAEIGNLPRQTVGALQPRDEDLEHLEFYIERKLDGWAGYFATVRVAVWEEDLFEHFTNIYTAAALAMWEERAAPGGR